MKYKLATTLTTAILAIGTASSVFAAETDQMPMQGTMGKGQQGATAHHGMMGQHHGTMGQQRGMMSCPMMGSGMRGGMMGSRGLPALPPGNEKLQLQMQAEIMQKVGEILAKYAAQVQ